MSRFQFSSYRTLPGLLLVLVLGLAMAFAACDSGGSNEDDSDNGSDNGDREVAESFTVGATEFNDDYAYREDNGAQGVAFSIGGQYDTGSAVITLERGKTYEFILESSVESGPVEASHPFYFGTSAQGAGSDAYDEGVEGANSTTGSVFFEVPSDAPSTLYFLCGSHVYMGGEIEITDASSSGNTGDNDPGSDY